MKQAMRKDKNKKRLKTSMWDDWQRTSIKQAMSKDKNKKRLKTSIWDDWQRTSIKQAMRKDKKKETIENKYLGWLAADTHQTSDEES